MLNRRAIALAVLLALFAVFTAGVAHLFILRFRVGDVYPPYSSLRADPLGGKALYDSFSELPHAEVSRLYRAPKHLNDIGNFTFLYTGVPVSAMWEVREIDELETLMKNGMRLVMTFAPVTEKPNAQTEDGDKEAAKKQAKTPREEKDEDETERILDAGEFAERWGFRLAQIDLRARDGKSDAEKSMVKFRAFRREERNTEQDVAWRTLTYFDKLSPDWRVIYECSIKPVIIERTFGAGSIVLCADTYFLSNEGLSRDRAPGLLAWLVGGNSRIVFDELHHGVSENPGVISLARKYGLGAFLCSLVLLAGLFVWQNIVPFVPPYREPGGDDEALTGKDSSEGFVNLLRRNIPPAELPAVCFSAWLESFAYQHSQANADTLARAESIVANARATRGRDAVSAFRELASLFTKKK